MAIKSKEKKLFSFDAFWGIDKKNKALNVNKHRATDGKNFVSDNGSLSTRPGFVFKEIPAITPGETIIGWYEYGKAESPEYTRVFITDWNIYFETIDGMLSVFGDANPKFTRNTSMNDFKNGEPFFIEEKDCLFIFGLNNVLVYSVMRSKSIASPTNHYVFYELGRKPNNPFLVSDWQYQQFANLPTPYEPTLFIGDNKFEDINLLSNVTKYKVFGSRIGDERVYKLPTVYNQEKHIDYEKNIKIYNGVLDEYGILPIFLGIIGSNVLVADETELENTYGDIYNSAELLPIDDVYFQSQDFKYLVVDETESPVDETIYLTKDIFFNLRLNYNGVKQSVFDFLINYIKDNSFAIKATDNNAILRFDLTMKVPAIYRDEEDKLLKQQNIEIEKKVYIQLKFKTDAYDFISISKQFSSMITDVAAGSPAYPTVDYDQSLYPADLILNNVLAFEEDEQVPSLYLDETFFPIRARKYIFDKREDPIFNDVQNVVIKQETYKPYEKITESSFDLGNPNLWMVNYQEGSYPEYPYFNNEGYTVITFNEGNSISVFLGASDDPAAPNWSNPLNQQAIKNAFFANVGGLTGYMWIRFRARVGNSYFTVSTFVNFLGDFPTVENREIRQTFAFWARLLTTEGGFYLSNYYDLKHDENEGAFILYLADVFFDYNKEPAIEISIKFEENPDYNLIIRNKFGITFGSENRLFLAGNPEYPNVDRYNVSNDLLGNNVKSQSYELTYFPSKNYRVVGGKGAINGYVIASDSVLYVTKEEHSGDSCLFIRERTFTDDGELYYQEHKTNINKTPINNKTITSFYNDIVMLTKDGLYGIQITQNVLTNERLLKIKSDLINEELVKKIRQIENKKDILLFTFEHFLFIILEKTIYLLDDRTKRYVQDTIDESLVYEIVKWETLQNFKAPKISKEKLTFLDEKRFLIYELNDTGRDDNITTTETLFYKYFNSQDASGEKGFQWGKSVETELETVETISFFFEELEIGSEVFKGEMFVSAYANIQNTNKGDWEEWIFLSPVKVTEPVFLGDFPDDQNLDGIESYLINVTNGQSIYKAKYNKSKKINVNWLSLITPFDNQVFEKTLFKVMFYASILNEDAKVNFGYKTMRTPVFDNEKIEIYLNPLFNFNEFNLFNFGFSTFEEVGFAIPTKQNNFLYIQFLFNFTGKARVNNVNFIYKNNRMLKSIG